jgi:CRISPR-associated protein Cmr3
MKIFIEPIDVLMFRDGRPFAGGDDHFAVSVFPPSPSTFYGAVRSHILSNTWSEYRSFADSSATIHETLRREIGTPRSLGTLTLTQCLVGKKSGSSINPLFPMPRDVVQKKGATPFEGRLLKPDDLSQYGLVSDMGSKKWTIWCPTEEPLESCTGFLSTSAMERYLLGDPPSSITEINDLYTTDERTMVRKSTATGSVVAGGLYTVEYLQLQEGIGFLLEVNGTTSLSESGVMRLGGDNRAVAFRKSEWIDISQERIKRQIAETRRLKVVLLTAAIFHNGWLPGGIDPDTGEGTLKGITVTLKGACVSRPLGIGGFDIVRNMPKVMQRAVPAGSVYFFELHDASVQTAFDTLWLKSISDERSPEGFGIVLIGGY